MKIYTKRGDRGSTSLFGGKQVSKASPRTEAYGTVDELNAVVGVVRSLQPPRAIDAILSSIQEDLFMLGAELASPRQQAKNRVRHLEPIDIQRLESSIDAIEAKLPPLKSFILPGGSPVGAQLHIARTVCRRMERRLVLLSRRASTNPAALGYVNRLSDLFFVLSRLANAEAGTREVLWVAGRESA